MMDDRKLDQALELLDRRYGLVAVHKGLVPRDTFKRIVREYTQRSKSGDTVSVWDLMRAEGLITAKEMQAVLPVVAERLGPADEVPPSTTEERPQPKTAAPASGETGVGLTVSEDRMQARIGVKAGGLGGMTLDALKKLLAEEGIAHGLSSDEEFTQFLQADAPGAEMIVARGKRPKPGQPDELQCHFDTNPHRIGTLLEDGTMDWKDRGDIPQSAEGDLLAEVRPGRPGTPGVDVHGHVVAPEENKKLRVRAGKGATVDEEGTRIFATRNGQPYLSLENKVMVMPVLKIAGDVGIETGHVEYEGHVEVPGTVQDGYRVRAESLAAGEIHSNDVVVEGDVVVRGGIYGARIKAAGNLKAHHVNRSDLLVQGDIAIQKELVESTAQAGGRCLMDGGVILASEVTAAKGISCGDVGAESANDSKLQVGKDPWLKEAIADRRAQLKAKEARREALDKEIASLTARGDTVGTELGEIAQVQDKKMVARRELQEKIKKEKRRPTAKEQVKIQTLGREVESIDKKVASLMEEEETLDAEVAAKRAEVDECADTMERLNAEINSLTSAAKANPSHTQIKISGRIFENTDVRGYHAKLRIRETVSRCVISEKLDTDPATSRKWYLAISAL